MTPGRKRKRTQSPGRPPGGDADETRRRIVDAAIEEFAANGYSAARVVRIAERAGLTHAMLHYYFDTKLALYKHVLGTLAEPFRSLLVAPGAVHLDVARLAAESFRLFAENRAYVRIVLWELAAGGGLVKKLGLPSVEALESGLLGKLSEPIGREVARQAMASLLGATLIYFFDDPTVEKLFGRERFDRRAIEARAEHLAKLASWLFGARKS